MPSVNTVMLIFALAALAILALSALVGFLAGLKRELKLTIVFVVLLGLVWLVLGNASVTLDANLPAFATTMLRDALSGMVPSGKLGDFDSLRELIVQVVNGLAAGGSLPANIADLMVEGTKTYALIMSVVDFVVRFALILVGTIVVYVLFIVIRVLSFIIGSIYRLCTIRRRRRKRELKEAKRETGLEEGVVVVKSDLYDGEVVVTLSRNPKKVRRGKRRGWAAGLGLLRGALTVLLICAPITGLLSIVNEVEPETVDMVTEIMGGGQSQGQVSQEDDSLLDWVFEFADAYDKGIVSDVISASGYFLGKDLDVTLFDNLLKIETSTQTIYVREEIIKLVQIANILPEAYNPDKSIPIDIWALSDVKQDQIFELLKDFKLLYEIMPVAIEFAGSLDMAKDLLEPSGQSLAPLSTVDWTHDLPLILDAVREALELGDITVNFDPLKLDSDVLRVVVANIGATDFIAKLMPIVINAALHLQFVEGIIGEWPEENVIKTDGIVWENEFVNLVDIYALFQDLDLDLSNLDVEAIISDSEKMDIVKEMLTHLFTSDLFLDVLLQVLDVAKEFQLGNLGFEEFKNILKLTNLVAEDWAQDVNTLVDMVALVEELGVLSAEGIDFYNYDAIKGLITKLFDLMILSNKAGVNYESPEAREVQEVFNEVKTLLVEAALRQFDLFDVEGGFQFEEFTKEERSAIEWENEKQMLLNVVDVYAGLMDFLKTKDITFDNLGDNINNILNYDETFDYLIDLLDALIDSDLAMTLIPYALDKFVTPIIEDFEGSATLPDGDKIDITDKVNKDNISEEIFNLIYILMDARELGLIGVVTGEMNFKLGALAYNPDSASFKEMSDKLGYAPAADDLALVDIINRVFNSKLFEGNEAKLFRVLFAVFVDTRISKGAINAIEFSDPEVETSERNIIISAINGLRPILDDPEFKLFDDEGNLAIDMDYFLDKDVVLSIVDSVRKLFSSQLIAVLLPELYNQYLIPQGIVPEEFANVIKVQSLYLAEHKNDEAYLEGLTGAELTQDIVTVLSIAELLIDFDVLNILAEEADIKFADAADTFDRLFDLVLQLNVLRDNGNELASALVKMLLDVEVPVEKFEELNVNWKEEVQGVKGIFRAVFDLLLNSGIDGYKTLNEVLENPMGHLENFLVDANVQALADILNNIADSKALAAVALPLVNKFVPGMVEGLEEFTEEELTGEMITADIKSLATILGNVAEAKLMATVKVILGEFTDLIEEQDTNVVIPLRHDLYAEIVEELFGLNLLQVESVKAFIVETLSGIAQDIDFSSVDPKALNFAADGKVLADAYRAFAKGFHQDIFANLSVQDILAVINGEKELTEFVKVATQANYDAVKELVKSVLSTTLVKEFALVAFNFAKGLVPEDLAFLVNVELTKDQLLADIESIGEVINSVIMILKPAIKEIKNNLEGILDGTVDILSLELAIDTTGLYDKVETIAKKLDDLYLFDTRGKELIVGIFGMLDIELTEEDLATVVWADEKANAKAAVQTLANFAKRNDIRSLQSALALANNLSLENTDLINTQNVLDILDIVLAVLNSEFVKSVFGPVYDALLKDMLPEVATSILAFDEEYTAYNFIEEIAQIISGLRSIVSFELIEFVNAQGKLNWQEFNKVSDGIRQIFSVKLLDKAERTVLDLLSESAGLTLVDVLDINWAQTGDQLASALEHFVNAINQAGVLDEMADLETISEHISAFYNDQIITEFINGLYDLVNMQILEALFPTVINFVANGQMLPEAISELLLMEGLSGADYVADLNTIVSILEDVQNMGLVSILQGIANSDTNSITLRNLDNIVTILDKVIKLRFWDNKRIETIEAILTICGVEVTNELDGLDTAKENQILLDVFRELISLVDTLFATQGQVVVGDVMEYFNGLDNAEYAKLLNNGLLTIANIFETLSESAYVRVLTAPIYSQLIQPSLEEAFVGVVGEQNTSIVSLDCYLDNPQALSDDLAKIALFFRQLHTTELINIIFDSSFLINYGQLRYLADAVETIFSLEILASKEAVIVDILNYIAEGYVLSDGNIDFSKDGTTFKDIINTLLDFANSGVVCINTFADVELAMSGQIQILYENLLCGGQPAIKLVFDALKTIGKFTFLDEVFAFAHNLVKESVTLPEGLEFLLELGPNGTPGLVGDYVTIITAVEDIFDLGYCDLLIGKDVKIEFAATLAHVVDSFFNLDFFQGKGDKVIEYAADMIGYPGLAEALPHNWAAENEAFANIFYQLESIMYEWGLFYVSDFGTFVNSLVDMNAIVGLFSDNVLEMLRSIARSVVDSIVVQATLGAAAYFALPLVEASLPENMQPLVRLDDITVGELVEDVMSIVAIVADFDNFNLFGAILFSEDLIYDAPAYNEPNKYAVAHVFETLFGLNYINAKLDTIAQIVSDMNPDFAAIDFEFLQSEAFVETYSVELVGTGMSNFAYDGVKLAQMYTDLVDTVFTDPKWSLYSFNDFGSIQILDDFYSRNIINGLVDAIAQLLDLNTIQAALPYAYDLLGNMFGQNDFGFIVEYVLETPADELQEDIVTIISSLKALADNHEFIYEEDLRNFINSGNLGYLNFNLSTVQALPDILNDLSKLNVLSYVKGERLVEIIKYVLNVALPTFDQTNIDWAPISEMLNYAGSEFEELTAFVEAIDILAKILYEDVKYTEFKELYTDLYSIRISQNERLLNADVVNSVLDIVQIFVDSSLVESFFYAVYDNFLAATVEGMTPVNQLLDVYKYGSVVELQEDLTAILNIVRELVKFDVLGIAFFERDIEWTNTEPIENIFRNLFGLNYLEADAGLPLIVEFLNEMVDLSALDVEALGASLEGFGEALALTYRILATEIFATEAFPIHSSADLANIVIDVAKFLEPGILNSALNAVQAIIEADFVEELLEAGFYIAQLNVPDNLFFLVQNQLTGDQLQHDLVSILDIVRELIDAEAYNIMLQDGNIALDGIADHLIAIVDLLVHTNLISNDPNNFVAGVLGLAGIYVSVDELETVDYQHDLANIYAIFTILEDILDKAKFENHLDIMNFINNLNVNELLYNEDLLCETNLMNVLDILDNIVDLSLIPAIFEPAYNSLVDLNSVSDQIYPFMDLAEYPAELLVEDAKALVNVLRNLVDFDALSIVRGYAINWDNIEAIENVINIIFGLNYLEVKLDDILFFLEDATAGMFNISLVNVENVDLENDGALIAAAYRLLAENVLSENWFPIQYVSDLQTLDLTTLPLDKLVTEEKLTALVQLIENILNTSLVYEGLAVAYDYLQNNISMDLSFVVNASLSKDQLHEDVMTIVYILREAIATKFYNTFLGKAIPLAGLTDHVENILRALFGINLLEGRLNDLVFNGLMLAGLPVDQSLVEEIDMDQELETIYAILGIVDDILRQSEFKYDTDITNFLNSIQSISDITSNEKVFSNNNLLSVLEILENIVSLELIHVLYEPVIYATGILDSLSNDIYPLLDISEYSSDMLVEDLESIISVLRSVVRFDVLNVLRGHAIDWANIEDVENIFIQLFGLNYLEVKLDDILFYFSASIPELLEIEVDNVNLAADGEKIAKAYRLIAENVLTQSWFPIQFLNDALTGTATLSLDEVLNDVTLNGIVDALAEILHTTLVYEALPVAYSFAQTNISDDLYFLVANSLTKEELAEDVDAIILVLREVIASGAYNFALNKGVEIEGLARHISTILDILLHTNILGNDYAYLFENVFGLVGLPVSSDDLETVKFEQDFAAIYAVLENIEDVFVRAKYETHLDVLSFLNSIQSFDYIINNRDLVNDENVYELIDSLDLLIDLTLVEALIEPLYDQFVQLDSFDATMQVLLDMSNYGKELLIADLHTLVDVLRQVVKFGAIDILRGEEINFANTQPIETIINSLFGLNYLEAKLQDIVNLVIVEGLDTSLIDADLIVENLEADGLVVAKVYSNIAKNILARTDFPGKTVEAIMNLTLDELKEFYSKDLALEFISYVRPLVDMVLTGEALEVAYNFAQYVVPSEFAYLLEQSLTKGDLANDVHSVIDIVEVLIESDLIKLAVKKDIPLAGISAAINEIIDIVVHTNIFGRDLARVFEGTLALAGLEVAYDDLAKVNYREDFKVIYSIVEDVEAILINSKFETVLGAVDGLQDAIASGTAVLRNKDLVNDANVLAVLDIIVKALDLTLVEAVAEPLYETAIENAVNEFGLPEALADTNRYGYADLISDVKLGINMVCELVAFGVIGYYQDNTVINFANTEPIVNIIANLFSLEFLDEFDEELISFAGEKLGIDFTDVDVDSINWVQDAQVFAYAYVTVATRILADAEFPVKRYSDIRSFEFDIHDYAKERYALAGLEALDLCIGTTIFDAFGSFLLDYANNNYVPEGLRFIANEANLTKSELRSDAHALIDVAEIAINSGLAKLAVKKDMPLAGISTPINSIIEKLVHLNILSRDYARLVSGVLAYLDLEVSYDELTKVDFEGDFETIYSLVEDVEAILINSKFETVLGAVDGLQDAIASGTAVLRNKDLVNDANVLAVLDILVKVIDLEVLTAVGTDLYPNAIQKVVNEFDLPVAITDTNRYAYADLISDAKLGIDMVRELVAFGVIGYFQDNTEINFAYTTPIENIINKLFTIKFLDEFDKELIKFAGEQIGIDFSDVDVDSINWQLDAAVFAEAYVTVATRILADAEFPVKRYSDIRSFEFNAGSYAKERYALAGIDALDLLIDTTIFDAFGLFLLDYANNNVVPEDLRFVINEANLTKAELRLDAHAILSLAESAINEGFGSLVTEKDCDINKPNFYKEVIEVLFDLNIVEDAEIRSRLINYALDYAGLEQIVTIYDWDYEEVVYKLLVDKVCEFLASQDLATAKKLYSFAINKEFMTGAFLSDANLLEILDIAEVAVKSELVSKVSASVYTKVINELPYEGVKDLLVFGTGARDYTKDGFYDDLPQLIVIAREMINLHMLDVIRVHNWEIASSAQINKLIDEVMKLNVLEGRLDLFADFVFSQVEVEVDLTYIDWENEIQVLQNVITLALPALKDSGMIMLSDAKALAQEIIASPVDFVKNNRAYMNLANAYVALDVLTELGNSEVYMRSILPLYDRVSAQLPAVVTENIDLTTYDEFELRDDYADVLAIARYGLDGKLYKALSERRAWEFPIEAVDALENIIAIATELNFTARYTEGIFKVAGSLLGIDLPTNLDEIYLAQDKDELVSIVSSAREIWIGTNHIRPNIPMFANTSLFEEISFVLDTLLDTTVVNVFAPWAYEVYAVEAIANIPDLDGNMNLTKLQSYVGQQVIDLFEDGIVVLNELIAMGVFSSTGIDFSDNTHVEAIVDILLEHVEFSSKFENYIVKATERAYLMGVIPTAYEDVESTRGELSLIKSIATSAIDLLETYGSSLASSNFAALVDGTCEAEVLAIIDKVNESVLLNAAFIPAMNGFGDVVMGPEFAGIYEACQVATVLEFKDAVAGLFDILEQANNVGILSKQVQYKNTDGIKALIQLIEHSPFFQGQEGVLAEFVLRHTDYIDHNEVDLINIDWANEYQYLYAFLDKANAPLNMEGIVIDEYRSLLENELFIKDFTEALRELAPSELMVEMFMPVYENIVVEKVPVVADYLDYSHFDSLSESDYEAAVSAEYLSVLDLLVAISASGLMNDTNLVNLDSLLDVYDIVFALEGTKNNKADIFTKLSDKLPSFGDSELVIPSDVNWDTEIPAIRGIFASLENFADIDGNINISEIGNVITESTDVKAFEDLLTAVNHSVIYREQIFNTLNSEINNLGSDGDITISNYLTDWFKDQTEDGMLGIAAWEDEMIYIARILTIINYMRQHGGISDFGSMTLGDGTVDNAVTIATDDFNVADYGLKQLLQLMSASDSFTLTALNNDLEVLLIDNAEHDGVITTDKHINALNDAEWDAEIDDLITLLHNIQVLGVLDNADFAGSIASFTTTEVEELLSSFNHCEVIRPLLPDLIASTLDSAGATDWKSEWLAAQVGVDGLGHNKPMATESAWDLEASELASMISLVDGFDFNKGISEYSDTEINALRELLHAMNHSQSLDVTYIITFLNANVLENNLIETDKRFEKPNPDWSVNKWDDQLDKMVDVIDVCVSNGLFESNSGDALANLEEAQIKAILQTVNASEIMRTVLPDLVYSAVKAAGQTSWLTQDKWLENQTGVDAFGNNKPVADAAIWDEEIEQYAYIISAAQDPQIDFADLDLTNNVTLVKIELILAAMNKTRSFALDPITDIINDILASYQYNVQLLGVMDGANKGYTDDTNGTNKDEWATELHVLMTIVDQMNDLGAINADTLKTESAKLGLLLNTMRFSYLFGNDVRDDDIVFDSTDDDNMFNELVLNVLETSGLMKSGSTGLIDPVQAAADDWTHYDWQKELAILSAFDTNATSQTDEFIGDAQDSEIIENYFNIADQINEKLDVDFTVGTGMFAMNLNLKTLVTTANGGNPLTNDYFYTPECNWADEIADINRFKAAIDNCGGTVDASDKDSFKHELDAIRVNDTLAGNIADVVYGYVDALL